MGQPSPSGQVGLPALDRSQNMEMVQDLVHTAFVWQTIQQSPDRFLDLHDSLLEN
jgi:hypothetical protein